ncbi:MAG: glycosyltransferase family 4 protein, partial [Phycisphaeraceae bacterium]|nr:glycosyltransferase family 4 protein [Phycisphaeraceae bacterium]
EPHVERSLREQVADANLTDRVFFHGRLPVDQTREMFDRAHLFVLASRRGPDGAREAQGVVVQEAQACGLPTIVARSGGLPESVIEGKSALLFDEGDADDLSAKLSELLQSPQRWPTMGRAGRLWVKDHFSLKVSIEQILAVYREAITG